MTEPQRLPFPRFRLPDGSVATVHSNGNDGTLEGVRTLPTGVTLRFSVARQDWERLPKERVTDPR